MRIGIVSYAITEESGGPGVAAAGFATALARRGHDVRVFATERPNAHWLIDHDLAAKAGFGFVPVRGRSYPTMAVGMMRALETWGDESAEPAVLWINGIWAAQSVAGAWIARRRGWKYVVRPAGSLGLAALSYKRLKKALYYRAVERRVLLSAGAIHCMSEIERDELPAELRPRAFIVPTGVEVLTRPDVIMPKRTTVGVLARIHPIKNQHLALDAIERVVAGGIDVELEMAGSVSDPAYQQHLATRIARTASLRDRVRFLGHVRRTAVAETVARWRVALLLSQQENFGHAVVSAAACGVPSVVSHNVALAPSVAAFAAGIVCVPEEAAEALRTVLEWPQQAAAERARAMAATFSWESCAARLESELERVLHT